MTFFAGMTEKQLLVITGAVVAACVVVLGIGIGYGRLRHSRIVAQTKDTKKKLRELPKLKEQIVKLNDQRENMAAVTEEMRKILPSEQEAGEHDFRSTISIYADDAGLDWISFKRVSQRVSRGRQRQLMKLPYIKEDYALEVSGGFHALATFINKLEEECSRLLWVSSLSIKGASKGLLPEINDHEITITLVTCKFRKVQAAKAP